MPNLINKVQSSVHITGMDLSFGKHHSIFFIGTCNIKFILADCFRTKYYNIICPVLQTITTINYIVSGVKNNTPV